MNLLHGVIMLAALYFGVCLMRRQLTGRRRIRVRVTHRRSPKLWLFGWMVVGIVVLAAFGT